MFQKTLKLNTLLKTKIFRQLVLGCLMSIVALETVLLLPSIFWREQELLNQVKKSTINSAEIVNQVFSPDLNEAELLQKIEFLLDGYVLGGHLYNGNTGRLVGQFGEAPTLTFEQSPDVDGLRQGDRYDVALSLAFPQGESYWLVLRQDASSIQGEVLTFALLIAAFVAVSSILLTGVVATISGVTVISPLLKLRQNLMKVAEAGSQGEALPAFEYAGTLPKTELGEVLVACQQIAGQLWAAIDDRQAAEHSGQAANEQLGLEMEALSKRLNEKTQSLIKALVQLEVTQEELIKSERKAALGQLVVGIAHELNTPLGAMQASAESIVYDLKILPEVLPHLWQDLTPENQAQFNELVQQAAQRQTPLSTRDRRQCRQQLQAKLVQEGVPEPQEVAEICIDLGVQDNYQRYLSLLAAPENLWLRQFVQQTYHLHGSSRRILTAVGRTSKIISALKSYAQMDMTEALEATDLTILIYKALSLYPSALCHGVKVTRLYEPLPPIWCYPKALTQVWANLFQNALQAIAGEGEITISARVEGDFAVVSFEDSGPGIPEEIQERIFEPFFTTHPSGEGSGLGLGVCQQVVEQHGGYIEMTSQPGATVFTVLVPLEPVTRLV